MDALPLQVVILEGVCLSDVFQILNDDVLADAEIAIPAGAYLRGDVLKMVLFGRHPAGYPLIGVVVAAGLVPLKDVGPLSAQRLSQVLQQHIQRLVRSFFQQGDAEALVDDGLQILNALHTVPMAPASWPASVRPLKRFP